MSTNNFLLFFLFLGVGFVFVVCFLFLFFVLFLCCWLLFFVVVFLGGRGHVVFWFLSIYIFNYKTVNC